MLDEEVDLETSIELIKEIYARGYGMTRLEVIQIRDCQLKEQVHNIDGYHASKTYEFVCQMKILYKTKTFRLMVF